MKIAFVVHTPGQANFWHYSITTLNARGNDVAIIARDDGLTCQLLSRTGLKINMYGKAGKAGINKLAQLPNHILKCFSILRNFHPDIILGTGLPEAYSAFLLRKPCFIFEDSETPFFMGLERMQWKKLASIIFTPDGFRLDFGKKHIRFCGYKEIAYLHPNFFRPDPSIYDRLKIERGAKYTIIRLNSWDAVHDIGRHGFSVSDQFELIKELAKYNRVFISPEGSLAEGLEKYVLPIPKDLIHHALYYAHLLVSDTQTMTTEAAILGTPAVRCNSFVGPDDMSNFIELEKKYDLIYSFASSEQAIQKALELVRQPDLKEQWAAKRQKLLDEKIDVTQFMVDFIANYPESFRNIKQKEVIHEVNFHNRNASAVHKVRSAFKRAAKNT